MWFFLTFPCEICLDLWGRFQLCRPVSCWIFLVRLLYGKGLLKNVLLVWFIWGCVKTDGVCRFSSPNVVYSLWMTKKGQVPFVLTHPSDCITRSCAGWHVAVGILPSFWQSRSHDCRWWSFSFSLWSLPCCLFSRSTICIPWRWCLRSWFFLYP